MLTNLTIWNKCIFLETCSLPRPNHEKIEDLNRPQTSKEIESVIKNFSTKKSPGLDGFITKFYQTLKELMLNFLKLFQKIEEVRTLTI